MLGLFFWNIGYDALLSAVMTDDTLVLVGGNEAVATANIAWHARFHRGNGAEGGAPEDRGNVYTLRVFGCASPNKRGSTPV